MPVAIEPPRPKHPHIAEWSRFLADRRDELPIQPGDVRRDIVELHLRWVFTVCAHPAGGCFYSDDERPRRWWTPWRRDRRCTSCRIPEHWVPGQPVDALGEAWFEHP